MQKNYQKKEYPISHNNYLGLADLLIGLNLGIVMK